LLEQLQLSGRRVAVALNRDVVPRSAFACTQIATGDQVEILEAVGGG
jgi:sulfur carrier protein